MSGTRPEMKKTRRYPEISKSGNLPSISKDYTINMAWRNVTNSDANGSVNAEDCRE
ncbi:MAG: hypothetical protein ACLTLQ_02675 [[Clostridium] scindens]